MGDTFSKENSSSKKHENEEKQHIFGYSLNGLKKELDQVGQDSFDIILTELGSNIRYFGIFDGHGLKGKEASQIVKEEIHKTLLKEQDIVSKLRIRKEVEKYFYKLYSKIQAKFRKSQSDYESSGTCAIAVLIISNNCFTINLGDSRAVIGHLQEFGQKVAYQMSIDHKPNRQEEKERIEKNGGYVGMENPGAFGPYRVYSKIDDGPGLAVSRSFGDLFGHTVGISIAPEVSYKMLEEKDLFVVIASDGVWDVMNSPEVVGFVFDKMDKTPLWNRGRIAEDLVRECRFRWEQINAYKEKMFYEMLASEDFKVKGTRPSSLKKNIDDITAIICFLTIVIDEQK